MALVCCAVPSVCNPVDPAICLAMPRGRLDELQRQMLVLRDNSANKARDTGNTLVFLLVVAAAVIVVAGVALLLSLNRVVIGPVTDLADQVRDVRAGDCQRPCPSKGHGPLTR